MAKAVLASHPFLVLDGAFATCLESHQGVPLHQQLWSAAAIHTHPDAIKQVHLAYLNAGADIVCTATYQASYEGFKVELGFDEAKVDELLRLSVDLARAAVSEFTSKNTTRSFAPLIAASMGPYGAALADGSEFSGNYIGRVGKDELKTFHRRRAKVLASHPGVDILAFETIPSWVEAEAIAEMLVEEAITVPAWISFSCCDGKHTSRGEPVEEAMAAIARFDGIIAAGINCTSPKYITSLVPLAKKGLPKDRRLIVYPNKGGIWDNEARSFVPDPDEGTFTLPEYTIQWRELGANICGGCCRTEPDIIHSIHSLHPNR